VWSELSGPARRSFSEVGSHNNPSLSYSSLSPTHYKVKIENLKDPVTLAFSESFDNRWQLNSQNSTSLYNLINGFYVEKNGEYDITFEPQKFVNTGMIISGGFLAVLILYFLYTFINEKSRLIKKDN
jgi:hypothetical protein